MVLSDQVWFSEPKKEKMIGSRVVFVIRIHCSGGGGAEIGGGCNMCVYCAYRYMFIRADIRAHVISRKGLSLKTHSQTATTFHRP